MIRRDFIRLASLTAGSLPLAKISEAMGTSSLKTVTGVEAASGSYELFANPQNQYRPFVRWWWNGDRLAADELLRELDVLKAAGIGGVEINPIKFPDEADPMSTKTLTWLSDDWIDMLSVALKGAKEKGIICDMIVGSGWPFGGEFLTREEQTQMIALGTKNISGTRHLRITRKELLDSVNPAFVSTYKNSQKELFSALVVPAEMKDLSVAVPLNIGSEKDDVEFDVPEGNHVLYYLVKITGFMAVINGAPGASGPVLNHYNQAAVEKYLDRLSERLTARIGPLNDHFRAFFTDSIELEGANWCSDMFEQFRKKRGYDLAPWFPFMLFKVGEMGNAVDEAYGANFTPELKERIGLVRYDFETTKHELFQERFIKTFAAWCVKNGVKSRMQAYGMDCDPIASGMMVDIPECETWIWSENVEDFGDGDYHKGRNYTMINKFVSSSAHLSGKKLISCEEMTNTGDPFHASLERIKLAGDQSILSGVTGSVLHGFNYSPLDAPFPGWVRYGTYFNERNTWWPYFRRWSDYKARLSALFQQCTMQADIAVLYPMADMASKYGFQRDPFPRLAYPPYVHKIWETIHQNGSGCDYLSEEIVAQCKIKNGQLVYGNRGYKAILMPDVESINVMTAKALQKFADAGGRIIFIGKAPHLSAGLTGFTPQSQLVAAIVNSLIKSHPRTVGLVQINEKDIVGWYRKLQQQYSLTPDVAISKPVDFISQLHYSDGQTDFFFFTNYGPERSNTFEAVFNTGRKTAWLWNAETGEKAPYPATAAGNTLTITLGPSESKLIAFETSANADGKKLLLSDLSTETIRSSAKESTVSGSWEVALHHMNGVSENRVMNELKDFSKDDALKTFAGSIVYRNTFKVSNAGSRIWLDLGRIRCVSELEINGRRQGVKWYGDHLYEITGAVVEGDNYCTITLITTLGNYMKNLKNNRAAVAWTADTPYYPMGLVSPVKLYTAS